MIIFVRVDLLTAKDHPFFLPTRSEIRVGLDISSTRFVHYLKGIRRAKASDRNSTSEKAKESKYSYTI